MTPSLMAARKARKPPYRPALRDSVIRPGGTCDPRALSCSFFEPSAPPLSQTLCRGRQQQRQTLPGPENVIGRLTVFCPASRRFLLYCPQHRGASVLLHSGEQRPQRRVLLPQRSKAVPGLREGHTSPHRGDLTDNLIDQRRNTKCAGLPCDFAPVKMILVFYGPLW